MCGGTGEMAVIGGVYRLEQPVQHGMINQEWSAAPTYTKQGDANAAPMTLSKVCYAHCMMLSDRSQVGWFCFASFDTICIARVLLVRCSWMLQHTVCIARLIFLDASIRHASLVWCSFVLFCASTLYELLV